MSYLLGNPSLLIALPLLQDPNFSKSVILLLEHNKDGAMGLVINQPSPFMMKDVIEDKTLHPPDHIPAWFGGPVGTAKGVILHNQEDSRPDSVYGNLKISSSKEALNKLLLDEESKEQHKYRFIIGYSGWGPGQLEEEMKAGAWLHQQYSEKIVFKTYWRYMWSESMTRIGVNPMDIAPSEQSLIN